MQHESQESYAGNSTNEQIPSNRQDVDFSVSDPKKEPIEQPYNLFMVEKQKKPPKHKIVRSNAKEIELV